MYKLFLSTIGPSESGYFTSLYTHKGEEYLDKYSGKQRVKPKLTWDDSKVKQWKTKEAAVKYANTLASRVKTIQYIPQLQRPYRHSMKYQINIIDINSNTVVYTIDRYTYDDIRG